MSYIKELQVKTICTLLFAISFFSTGCAKKIVNVVEEKKYILESMINDSPIIYESDSVVCQKDELHSDLGNYFINQLSTIDDGKLTFEELKYNFENYHQNSKRETLYSSAVANVIYGEEYRIITEKELIESGNSTYVKGITFYKKDIKKGKTVAFCEYREGYSTDSIEQVSLNVMAAVNESYKFYTDVVKDMSPALKKIKKVVISVHPKIDHSTHKILGEEVKVSSIFQTDNLTYDFANNYINVFPTSQKAELNDFFSGVKLWEIPFTTIHEYGHHILYQVFKSSRISDVVSVRQKDKKNNVISLNKEKGSTRIVSIKNALNAIHEGFADLFAFYTLRENPKMVKGISGFDISRDVSSAYFSNHFDDKGLDKQKVLSDKILNEYFSNIDNGIIENYKYLNFQLSHTAGAIIAFTFNRLLDVEYGRCFGVGSDANASDEKCKEIIMLKMKKLIAWAEKLERDFHQNSSLTTKDFFDKSVKSFICIGRPSGIDNVNRYCSIINDYMPAYAHMCDSRKNLKCK